MSQYANETNLLVLTVFILYSIKNESISQITS